MIDEAVMLEQDRKTRKAWLRVSIAQFFLFCLFAFFDLLDDKTVSRFQSPAAVLLTFSIPFLAIFGQAIRFGIIYHCTSPNSGRASGPV